MSSSDPVALVTSLLHVPLDCHVGSQTCFLRTHLKELKWKNEKGNQRVKWEESVLVQVVMEAHMLFFFFFSNWETALHSRCQDSTHALPENRLGYAWTWSLGTEDKIYWWAGLLGDTAVFFFFSFFACDRHGLHVWQREANLGEVMRPGYKESLKQKKGYFTPDRFQEEIPGS